MIDCICAIDPGKTGAIAYFFKGTNDVAVYNMPKTDQEISYILSYGSKDMIYKSITYIEFIQARERDKLYASRFGKLMKNYGVCLGACYASGRPIKIIKSQVWMSRFIKPGMSYKDRKNRLWKIAKQEFPKLKVKKSQADALCLLLYAMNKEGIEYNA